MISEYRFRFNELFINPAHIIATLGYAENEIPEPFNTYLDEVYRFAVKLEDIRASIKIVDNIELLEESGELVIESVHFQVGKTLLRELRNSKRIAAFICTAGAAISNKSKELMYGEDPVKGFIYDVMGSYISEAVGDKMEDMLLLEFGLGNQKITNRYSPGYVKWSVEEQGKLFSLFEGRTIGVQLTSSSLMEPVKSISGVIGIGEHVKYRKNRCELCSSKNCMYKQGKNQAGDNCIMVDKMKVE
jgi:hypothetical protein